MRSWREVLEVEQRQVVVVAVLEDERQDARLRLVEVEDLAEQERPERMDGRADLRAELAGERQELDRVPGRLERQAEGLPRAPGPSGSPHRRAPRAR